MKVPKTIPAKNVDVDIRSINIDTENRTAKVVVRYDGKKEQVNVNLLPIYQLGTNTQKQTIKMFLRQIVATALNVDISEIPDIFN